MAKTQITIRNIHIQLFLLLSTGISSSLDPGISRITSGSAAFIAAALDSTLTGSSIFSLVAAGVFSGSLASATSSFAPKVSTGIASSCSSTFDISAESSISSKESSISNSVISGDGTSAFFS